MPCNDATSYMYRNAVDERAIEELRNRNDELARDNDALRETLLQLLNNPSYTVPKHVINMIEKDQIKHRKADLERLENTFRQRIAAGAAGGDVIYTALGKIITADPNKELESQLGFNPDEY